MSEPPDPMRISPVPSLLAGGAAFFVCLGWSVLALVLFGDRATTDAELAGRLGTYVGFVVAAAVATGTQLARSRPKPFGWLTLALAALLGLGAPVALALVL